MPENTEYRVSLTRKASKLLEKIKDIREQKILLARLEKLKFNPTQQGKALVKELSGYRSIRAVGQHYSIIYQVQEEQVLVLVIAIGRRKQGNKKDIYTMTQKILKTLESQQNNNF